MTRLASRAGLLSQLLQHMAASIAGPEMAPTFGQRYGANPKSHNGGQRSGAAAHQRAALRRRNIRKNPRGTR